MAARNLSARSAAASLDKLLLDPVNLRRARRMLNAISDSDAVNKALAILIANEEMEKAFEKTFGSLPMLEAV